MTATELHYRGHQHDGDGKGRCLVRLRQRGQKLVLIRGKLIEEPVVWRIAPLYLTSPTFSTLLYLVGNTPLYLPPLRPNYDYQFQASELAGLNFFSLDSLLGLRLAVIPSFLASARRRY